VDNAVKCCRYSAEAEMGYGELELRCGSDTGPTEGFANTGAPLALEAATIWPKLLKVRAAGICGSHEE